jgi:hypothetical protein
LTALHNVTEFWDGGSIKAFRGIVTMTPNDQNKPVVSTSSTWTRRTRPRSALGSTRSVPLRSNAPRLFKKTQ